MDKQGIKIYTMIWIINLVIRYVYKNSFEDLTMSSLDSTEISDKTRTADIILNNYVLI